MPKMKTKRAAAKRFKSRGSGSLKRWSAFKRHLNSSKSTKRKRHLRGPAEVSDRNEPELHRLMPYGARP